MSTGADNKTMPVTKEYEDGFERVFGKKGPTRGRWVWDRKLQKLVSADEYQSDESERALDAPIMVDRFYEGATVKTLDEKGNPVEVDIGSRQKQREYCRQNGLATADDFDKPGGAWEKAAKLRERIRSGEAIGRDREARREQIARYVNEHDKP